MRMKPEGWAVFEDGSITYMGFAAEIDFWNGDLYFFWKEVPMVATGTVIGMGIKSGGWKTATLLDRPLVISEPGSTLSIDITLSYDETNISKPLEQIPEMA